MEKKGKGRDGKNRMAQTTTERDKMKGREEKGKGGMIYAWRTAGEQGR